MNTHASKSRETKNHVVRNSSSKENSNSTSTFQFVDNRPEAITQRKLQEMANHQFSQPIQKQEIEEEELLQGKFKTPEVSGQAIQKQEIEEEELLQGKFKPVQRQEIEEEELLQGKFKTPEVSGQAIQKQEIGEEELLQGQFKPIQKQENNTGLPDNLKSGIENLSGYAMDDVKVHRNSNKPEQLQAHAYAQGTDIHLASGQEKHLPHEAWHVVQQKQGRVRPTMQMQGKVNVNDDVGLEKEADVMGAKALQLKTDLNNIIDKNNELKHSKKNAGNVQMAMNDNAVVQRVGLSETAIKALIKTMLDSKTALNAAQLNPIIDRMVQMELLLRHADYFDNRSEARKRAMQALKVINYVDHTNIASVLLKVENAIATIQMLTGMKEEHNRGSKAQSLLSETERDEM